MAVFRYKSFNGAGAVESGEIQASTLQLAIQKLHERSLQPFEIEEGKAAANASWLTRELTGSSEISNSELASIMREWATLISSDLPLSDVLKIASAHAPNARTRTLNKEILASLQDGKSFSEACAAQTGAFPNYLVSLLRAGEASGSLTGVTQDLANFLERSSEVRSRVTSALVYPSILLLMAIAAISMIALVLVPTLVPILRDARIPLPITIRIIEACSNVLAAYWPFILPSAVALVIAIIALWRNQKFAMMKDQKLIQLPVVGDFIATSELTRFSATLGLLLKNGVPVNVALTIVKDVARNRAVAGELRNVLAKLKEGQTLSGPLKVAAIFPETAVGLIASGELSGRLDDTLLHVARIFEHKQQRRIDRIVSLLTPTLTMLIGIGVGALMLSIMSAILSINEVPLQ